MSKRFVVPFAASGDKSVTPDTVDPSGAVSYPSGWGPDYQKGESDPGYKPVGRQEMNGVLNDITTAVGELQAVGAPAWVAPAGLVPPYAIKSFVRHNGENWLNLVNNNSAEPGTTGSNWVVALFDASEISPFRGRAVYKTPGAFNWTIPAGVTRAFVTVYGAGGGGAMGNSTPSGGGGGGIAKKLVDLTGAGATVALTVGTGGLAATVSGNSGGAGGASNFGAFCSGPGGLGGVNSPTSVIGSFGVGGDENLTVGTGASAIPVTGGVYGGAGGGCESPYGASGSVRPTGYGQGGAGRVTTQGSPGAHGAVIIEW